MTTWVKNHFSDPDRALNTLLVISGVAGVLGFVLVMGGLLLSR